MLTYQNSHVNGTTERVSIAFRVSMNRLQTALVRGHLAPHCVNWDSHTRSGYLSYQSPLECEAMRMWLLVAIQALEELRARLPGPDESTRQTCIELLENGR